MASMNSRTALLAFGALVALTVQGCSCKGTKINPVDQCKGVMGVEDGHDNACAGNGDCGDHYSCTSPKGSTNTCCLFADRACTTEADCCPGQTCPSDRKKCFDKVLNCATDSDCGDPAMFCVAYSDHYGMSNRCEFKKCNTDGTCQDGTSCFSGVCIDQLPCSGTCPQGAACVPDNNTCQNYAMPTGRAAAACPVSCMSGFIGTFNDNSNVFDSCNLPAVKCVCAELPSLQSNDLGRFSAITAIGGTGLFVSGYDGQYGDLVVHKFDATGKKLGIDYVDGVPNVAPTYGPSGARGGVVDPGPDVGRYTDIVAGANGDLYVSYYDVTNGDLKVAVRGSDGKWSNHKVDGDDSDTGLYTSIGVGSDGFPVV